jgi:hypothetical protein
MTCRAALSRTRHNSLVTTHGKVRTAFVPVAGDELDVITEAKRTLRAVYSRQDSSAVAKELRELSRERDQEPLGEAE